MAELYLSISLARSEKKGENETETERERGRYDLRTGCCQMGKRSEGGDRERESKVDGGGDYEPPQSGFKCQREKTTAARKGVKAANYKISDIESSPIRRRVGSLEIES